MREARKTPCDARQNRGRAAGSINPRVSSHHGPATAGPGVRPACGTNEMNDHPGRHRDRDRIRLIAIETMKGAFGNEGALRFFVRLQMASAWIFCEGAAELFQPMRR